MFNLKYWSHRILRDFFETGSRREIVDWKAYGYKTADTAYDTLRVSARTLNLPTYISYEKGEVVLFRLDI